MPRQRSAGRPATRPSVPAKAPAPQQSRPTSTYAPQHGAPPAAGAAPAAPVSQGPGLFGQMASTAAGVAVGSSIGHAIGGMFGGGSSAPEASADNGAVQNQQYSNQQSQQDNCAGAATSFTKCMDDNNGNMQICNWYLEQLKACQQAAKPY